MYLQFYIDSFHHWSEFIHTIYIFFLNSEIDGLLRQHFCVYHLDTVINIYLE